jgi:DNA-binding transcriptional regulator YhcF (GntR family)
MILRMTRALHGLVLGIRSDLVLLERTNPRPAGEVLVQLTHASGVALHRQIEASIRDGIRAGRLARGASLPATRALAAELGVSRGVVVEAYQQLVAEGYLTSRPGGYTRVAIGPETAAPPARPLPHERRGSTSARAKPTGRGSRGRRGCARSGGSSPRPPTRTSAT